MKPSYFISHAQTLLTQLPMHMRNIALGISVLLVAAGLTPASSSAAQQHEMAMVNLPDALGRTSPKPPVAAFSLGGSDNYRIDILGIGKWARVTASKDHAAAIYWTEDAATTTSGMRARFGNLGEISVTFRPLQEHSGLGRRGSCSSAEHRGVQLGTFVGKIRFHGEQRFTQVDSSRARGGILVKSACRSTARLNSDGLISRAVSRNQEPFVKGGAITRRGTISFQAGADAFDELESLDSSYGELLDLDGLRRDGVPFRATAVEARREMTIIRLVAAKGPKTSFLNDVVARTKTISPPPPFTGVGQFGECPEPTWRGTLRVSFPGRANERLIGDRFFMTSWPRRCG